MSMTDTPGIVHRSTVIKLFARTYLDYRIMILLMLRPLFPDLDEFKKYIAIYLAYFAYD